jgi:hypothetical protein
MLLTTVKKYLPTFGVYGSSFALLVFIFLLPEFAHAAVTPLSSGFQIFPSACNCSQITSNGITGPSAPAWGCIMQTFQNIITFIIGFAVILITVFLAWAGFTYMTSGGNPGKHELANKRIMNAVIGLLIVLCAYLLVDSILKVIYNPANPNFGPWNSILGGNPGEDCLSIVNPPNSAPSVGNPAAGAVNAGSPTTGAIQNTNNACTATALSGAFGNNAAAMSCVSHYEDGSCNPTTPSGTDIGSDGKAVSFGLFQINISANNLSQYPACESVVNNQPLNCTQAFSGGAYTSSNHSTAVSNQSLYNTCVSAVTNASCNEAAAGNILSSKGIGAWGSAAQNNCSSLVN